jgi:hypothetical protein
MKPDPDTILSFWNWFAEHQREVRAMPNADDPFWDTVLAELKRVADGLWFEMSNEMHQQREFVITAEGHRSLFPVVDEMIAAAPPLPGWVFVALKPALGFDFVTEYEGVKYEASRMWFLPLVSAAEPEGLGLRLGIPGLLGGAGDGAECVAWNVICTGLGERAAAQDVQYLEARTLPERPEDEGYIELPELEAYIAWHKRQLEGDGGG